MKSIKFFVTICFIAVTLAVSGQNQAAQTPQQPVKPNIIKKLPEKQQAMFDQMAKDLQLTDAQKAKAIELEMERGIAFAEKMKTATTDEQKAEIKKAGLAEYNQKLETTFGAELATKIKDWKKEYILKQRAAQAPATPAAPAK